MPKLPAINALRLSNLNRLRYWMVDVILPIAVIIRLWR